jgi:hypothetical protein
MNEEEIQAARARVLAGAEKPTPARAETEAAFVARSRAEEDQEARKQRLWASVSWTGLFTGPLGWLYLFLLWAASSMALVGILTVTGASGQLIHLMFPGGTKVLPIPPTVAVFFFWLWVRGAPARSLKREQAWVASLPFKLTGYEEALADSPRENAARLELRFSFDREPERLAELLGAGFQTNPRNGHMVWEGGIARGGDDHNRALRDWVHTQVEAALLPLHRAHPFTELLLVNNQH